MGRSSGLACALGTVVNRSCPMKKLNVGVLVFATLLPATFLASCGSDGESRTSSVLKGIEGVVFLQRAKRGGMGDIFQYDDYRAGGNIFLLSPPSADGKLTKLTDGADWLDADFQAVDLSFDAKEIVFSARTKDSSTYHLYRLNLDGTNPCMPGMRGACKITSGPDNYVYPIYVPGGRIVFMTNRNVEPGTPQFRDEYERGVTAQLGSITIDGADMHLGPRNLSHRVAPSLLSDGRIVVTQWDHLGMVNE